MGTSISLRRPVERRSHDVFDDEVMRIKSYARTMTSDPWLAEEATQETILRAQIHKDTYRAEGHRVAWLQRICRNAMIDIVRRRQRQRLVTIEQEEPISQWDGSPSISEIHAAVADLPLTQRHVLELCALSGYDYATTALLLGIPVGTVRSRLHRARAALAASLHSSPS